MKIEGNIDPLKTLIIPSSCYSARVPRLWRSGLALLIQTRDVQLISLCGAGACALSRPTRVSREWVWS
jgi:hypothetical protein